MTSEATASGSTVAPVPLLVIERRRGLASLRLRELWEYRELIYFLIWRDVKVRYKQTALGVLWVVLQPLMTTAVFTIFFDHMAKVGSDGVPYPLFSFSGVVLWNFFAQGLGRAAGSLVGSSELLKKVYFPRVIIPIAAALGGVIDLAIGVSVLAAMLVFYGASPGGSLVMIPVFVLMTLGVLAGAGLWLSALNVRFRDIGHIAPFFVQTWMFLSPVIYPTARVLRALEDKGLPTWLYGLNPMAGAIEGFRSSALGAPTTAPASFFLVSAAVTAVLVVTGAAYFLRVERTFADVV